MPDPTPICRPTLVLFDLDGTLADTAADLAAPVNAMRRERGLEPLPLARLRPHASAGARGLLGAGLGITRDDARFEALKDEFLARYEADMVVQTRLFDGMPALLDRIEAAGLAWGIVSNKVERYVRRIVTTLALDHRAATVIGGTLTPGDDADDARWVTPAELDELALTTGLRDYLVLAGIPLSPG